MKNENPGYHPDYNNRHFPRNYFPGLDFFCAGLPGTYSTFLIQTQGLNILTDPVWSERASPLPFSGPKRMRPPGIRFEDLPKIDIVLLTHNHYDHLDIRTMKRLSAEYGPKIFCPLGVGSYLDRKGIGNISEMDWWDEISIDSGLSLLCTPAQHFSGRLLTGSPPSVSLSCQSELTSRNGSWRPYILRRKMQFGFIKSSNPQKL